MEHGAKMGLRVSKLRKVIIIVIWKCLKVKKSSEQFHLRLKPMNITNPNLGIDVCICMRRMCMIM